MATADADSLRAGAREALPRQKLPDGWKRRDRQEVKHQNSRQQEGERQQ